MQSVVVVPTAEREALVAHFEAGHSPPMAPRVLAGFRLEPQTRGLELLVGIRWEQAHLASAVAASSRRSVRRHPKVARPARPLDDLHHSIPNRECEGADPNIGKSPVVGSRTRLVVGGPVNQRVDKDGRPRGGRSTVCVEVIVQRCTPAAGIEGQPLNPFATRERGVVRRLRGRIPYRRSIAFDLGGWARQARHLATQPGGDALLGSTDRASRQATGRAVKFVAKHTCKAV